MCVSLCVSQGSLWLGYPLPNKHSHQWVSVWAWALPVCSKYSGKRDDSLTWEISSCFHYKMDIFLDLTLLLLIATNYATWERVLQRHRPTRWGWFIKNTSLIFGPEKVLVEKETKWRPRGSIKVVVVLPTRDVGHFVYLINLHLLRWHESYITNMSIQLQSTRPIKCIIKLDQSGLFFVNIQYRSSFLQIFFISYLIYFKYPEKLYLVSVKLILKRVF